MKRAIIIAAFFVVALTSNAATNTLTNLVLTTVQACVNGASSGDWLILPAGSATWSSALNLNKPVTLQGAGIGVTVITGSATVINLSASSKTVCTRVTGMTINGNQAGEGIDIGLGGGLTEYGLFRIDRCRVYNCNNYYAVTVEDNAAGVIDHCTIEDSYLLFGALYGSHQDHSWQLPTSVGTSNNVVVEDNVFRHNSGGYMPFQGSFENGQGCRIIFRYNNFTNLTTTGLFPCFDLHGNQSVVDTDNTTSSVRGNRNCEWYKNTFVMNSASGSKFYYRGGMLLCYSNTWIGGSWDTGFRVNEEDGTSRWNYRNGWPGYDMHWLWSWNNVQNGSAMADSWYSALTPADDSEYLHNTTNINYVALSTSAPADPDLFMAVLGFTGGRVTTPFSNYTAFTYPHPMVTAQDSPGDTTPPVLSNVSAGTPGTVTATVTWDLDESCTNHWVTRSLSSNLSSPTTTTNTATGTSASVNLTSLIPGTTIYYAAYSVDTSGNVGQSSTNSFVAAVVQYTAIRKARVPK